MHPSRFHTQPMSFTPDLAVLLLPLQPPWSESTVSVLLTDAVRLRLLEARALVTAGSSFAGDGDYALTRTLTAKRVGACPAGGVAAPVAG